MFTSQLIVTELAYKAVEVAKISDAGRLVKQMGASFKRDLVNSDLPVQTQLLQVKDLIIRVMLFAVEDICKKEKKNNKDWLPYLSSMVCLPTTTSLYLCSSSQQCILSLSFCSAHPPLPFSTFSSYLISSLTIKRPRRILLIKRLSPGS